MITMLSPEPPSASTSSHSSQVQDRPSLSNLGETANRLQQSPISHAHLSQNAKAPKQRRILPARLALRHGLLTGSTLEEELMGEVREKPVLFELERYSHAPIDPGALEQKSETDLTAKKKRMIETPKFKLRDIDEFQSKTRGSKIMVSRLKQLQMRQSSKLGGADSRSPLPPPISTTVPQEDTSDAAYEKLHRKPENLEKRERRQEKERLIRDRAKLKERIEHLKVIDARMLMPIITAREHNRFGAAAAAAAAASDNEGFSSLPASHLQSGNSPRAGPDSSISSSSRNHTLAGASTNLSRLEALRKELLAEAHGTLRRYDRLLSTAPAGSFGERKKPRLSFADSGAEDSDAGSSTPSRSTFSQISTQSHLQPQLRPTPVPQAQLYSNHTPDASASEKPHPLSMTAGAIALRASRAAKKAAREGEIGGSKGTISSEPSSASRSSRHSCKPSSDEADTSGSDRSEKDVESDTGTPTIIVLENTHPNIKARKGGRFASVRSGSYSSSRSKIRSRLKGAKIHSSSSRIRSSSSSLASAKKGQPIQTIHKNIHARIGGKFARRSDPGAVPSDHTPKPKIKEQRERVPMAPGVKIRIETEYSNIHARTSGGRFAPKQAVAHLSSSPSSSPARPPASKSARSRASIKVKKLSENPNLPLLLPTHANKISASLAEIDRDERKSKKVKLVLTSKNKAIDISDAASSTSLQPLPPVSDRSDAPRDVQAVDAPAISSSSAPPPTVLSPVASPLTVPSPAPSPTVGPGPAPSPSIVPGPALSRPSPSRSAATRPGASRPAALSLDQARAMLESAMKAAALGSREGRDQAEQLGKAVDTAQAEIAAGSEVSLRVSPSLELKGDGLSASASSSSDPATTNTIGTASPSSIPKVQATSSAEVDLNPPEESALSVSASAPNLPLPASTSSRRASSRVKAIGAFGEKIPDWTSRKSNFDQVMTEKMQEAEWTQLVRRK